MQCGATKVNGEAGECVCVKPQGHKGLHEDNRGILWSCPDKTANGDCGCSKK